MIRMDKWQKMADKVFEAQNNRKYWGEVEAQLKSELIEYSGSQPFEGKTYKLDWIERLGSVQYKNIPELKTIDLDQYRGASSVMWKLVKKVELL